MAIHTDPNANKHTCEHTHRNTHTYTQAYLIDLSHSVVGEEDHRGAGQEHRHWSLWAVAIKY